METGGGIQAWDFLRRVADYRAAWRSRAGPPAAPDAGGDPDRGEVFPVRVQTRADLEAVRFDLLAWQDPRGGDGPASPFRVQDGMPEAAIAQP